jgi:hypothetical protein
MTRQQQTLSMLDDSSIAALYHREALTIFTYVLRRVPSREDAEDILLEVFLAALENESVADLNDEKQRVYHQPRRSNVSRPLRANATRARHGLAAWFPAQYRVNVRSTGLSPLHYATLR